MARKLNKPIIMNGYKVIRVYKHVVKVEHQHKISGICGKCIYAPLSSNSKKCTNCMSKYSYNTYYISREQYDKDLIDTLTK